MKKAELFNDCKNHLGEGVLWSKQQETLYWLDVPMPSRLFQLNMKNNKLSIFDMLIFNITGSKYLILKLF